MQRLLVLAWKGRATPMPGEHSSLRFWTRSFRSHGDSLEISACSSSELQADGHLDPVIAAGAVGERLFFAVEVFHADNGDVALHFARFIGEKYGRLGDKLGC